jgi:uncharacterized membrane protein
MLWTSPASVLCVLGQSLAFIGICAAVRIIFRASEKRCEAEFNALQERVARGEMTPEEFQERRQILETYSSIH